MSAEASSEPVVPAGGNRRAVHSAQMSALPKSRLRICLAGSACLCIVLAPRLGWACAACYGQSDSAMAAGMNWGIASLLGTIVFVLGVVAGFFIFLARRSVKLASEVASSSPERVAKKATSTEISHRLEAEPLAARGIFGPVSALARRRAHCAPAAQRTRN